MRFGSSAALSLYAFLAMALCFLVCLCHVVGHMHDLGDLVGVGGAGRRDHSVLINLTGHDRSGLHVVRAVPRLDRVAAVVLTVVRAGGLRLGLLVPPEVVAGHLGDEYEGEDADVVEEDDGGAHEAAGGGVVGDDEEDRDREAEDLEVADHGHGDVLAFLEAGGDVAGAV